MAKTPWMKWYPSDWRADPLVRSCSPVSRYVWMEMIGLMHEAEPYGHLILAGRAVDYSTLATLIGMDAGEVKRAVKELESRGVFSRTDGGVIFSRRMIRDENRRKTLAENGAKGGNPRLKKQEDKGGLDNQKDNQGGNQPVFPRSQKPEAREKETPSGTGGTGRPANDAPAAGMEDHAREIADVIHLTRPIAKADRDVLRGWLDDGLNFDFHVMPAVRDVAARELGRGKSISGFRYLDGAVREYADGWHRENDRLKAIAAGGRK